MEKKETCVILICMRKKCNRQAAPDRQKISSITILPAIPQVMSLQQGQAMQQMPVVL